MKRLRNLFYIVISIPVLAVLVWSLVLPAPLIKTTIENSISNHAGLNMNTSINGFKKGLFFSLYAESIELNVDKTPALTITDISVKINPLYLFKKQIGFSVKGKIGGGEIKGFFQLPDKGTLTIDKAELTSISYLTSTGLKGTGLLSAQLNMKNNVVDILFKIPDANINVSVKGIALPVSSFRKIQGAIQIKENVIKVTSVSLEAEKGYARLKGDITNGFMNLVLELMPSMEKLMPLESALINKYQITPGYYIIPIEEPVR